VEDTILCIAKAMRMQDNNIKLDLSARALLVCCLSSNLLFINQKLWLKFLYLIFDKQQNEIENYFKNNIDSLVQICTTTQRLQKVLIPFFLYYISKQFLFFSGTNLSYKSFMFNKTKSFLKTISSFCLSTC
jgi:hypothetical protein